MNKDKLERFSKILQAMSQAQQDEQGKIFYDFLISLHPPVEENRKPVNVGVLSLRSLFIQARFGDVDLACGTGFFVHTNSGPLLFTARHNVTGRHHITGEPLSKKCGLPNFFVVTYFANSQGMIEVNMPLYKDGDIDDANRLWMEHPNLGSRADVVALRFPFPLPAPEFAYDIKPALNLTADNMKKGFNTQKGNFPIKLSVPDRVSVIGFPFGIRDAGCFPVYATGFIATELDVPYSGLPLFLIDCRSRTGQSGSPVVAITNAGAPIPLEGLDIQSVTFRGGASRIVGLYSGRVNEESDLGFVWKTSLLLEMVEDYERGISEKPGDEQTA